MKKGFIIYSIVCLTVVSSLAIISCGRDVNSIGDTHFADDGAPLDTLTKLFEPKQPDVIKLYVETSGSMNGFFRANQPTNFKKTVWSAFSGMAHKTDGQVYPMSNGGDIDQPVKLEDFRRKMNAGEFVSNSSTHIPAMLTNILQNLDTTKNEVAVLVSDMKYSPMGASAAAELNQYREQIRNIIAYNPKISVSYVCASSEYLNNNDGVAEDKSPYIFLILGNSENVAAVRNDIARWCEYDHNYIESGDMAMNYHTPSYELVEVKNGVLSAEYPKTLITTYDREVNDTCSFILRVNMNGYPWKAVHPELLKDAVAAKVVYGSSVDVELLSGDEHLVDDHAYKDEFVRRSYADYLIKLYNVAMDDEVIEWTFSNKAFDGVANVDFTSIIENPTENDPSGLFSFNKFIEGCFNARLNTADTEPVRIFISSSEN